MHAGKISKKFLKLAATQRYVVEVPKSEDEAEPEPLKWWEKGGFSSEEEYEEAWAKEIRPMESHAIEHELVASNVKRENFPDIVQLYVENNFRGLWVWDKFLKRYREANNAAEIRLSADMLNEEKRPKRSSKDILLLTQKFAIDSMAPTERDSIQWHEERHRYVDVLPPESEKPENVHFKPSEELRQTLPPSAEMPPQALPPSVNIEDKSKVIRLLKSNPDFLGEYLSAVHSDISGRFVHLFVDGNSLGLYAKEKTTGNMLSSPYEDVNFEYLPESVKAVEVSLPQFYAWYKASNPASYKKFMELLEKSL